MPNIGLLSDTHAYLHPEWNAAAHDWEQLWHAGDIGSLEVLDSLQQEIDTKAVWGNIDDAAMRQRLPEYEILNIDHVKVLLIHILGYPGRLNRRGREIYQQEDPDLVIYGHSHLLRLDYDKKTGALFVNPGAIGNHGDHLLRTAMDFSVEEGRLKSVQVHEFGNRGSQPKGITKTVPLGDWPLRNAR